MIFNDFIEQGKVKRTSLNPSLIKSLIKTSEDDLLFLKDLVINEISARKIFSNYYDVLRSLLEALASYDGYKVYSHEAFTYFLKEKNKVSLADKFDRFRLIRNKINYYGKEISIEEVSQYKNEIIEMVEILNVMLKGHDSSSGGSFSR